MDFEIEKPERDRAPEILPPEPATEKTDLDPLFRRSIPVEIVDQTGFHSGPRARRKGHRLAAWSWLASFIDTLILISLSCVFLLVFSMIMKTGAGSIVRDLRSQQSLAENFLQVFILSSWIYMITLRAFLGSSIGEWACDLRIGKLQDRLQRRYILRVILRESVILATGLVTLPLLSLIWGRDLAGQISGVSLFSLK